MLTPEHVRARRDGTRLVLLELSADKRARAVELADRFLERCRLGVGKTRDEIERSLAAQDVRASERRIAQALGKLVLDACVFEQSEGVEPPALRREVFLRSAAARRAASPEAPFSKEAVLAASGRALGLDPSRIEEMLYADLRGAHRLIAAPNLSAEALVRHYEQGQIQAVLLRAVSVVADVRCTSPDSLRYLFQKLKFRRLLYRCEALSNGVYRLSIDGPFSLFEAVTKYGLELALTLPALEACDELELKARVLWGSAREPLEFEHRRSGPPVRDGEARLRDEIVELLHDFEKLDTGWQAAPAEDILDVPGVGVCVPDLLFRHREGGDPVYFELLGYWSRDAVFRRVELVERGLSRRILFGVSARLRVSEAVLDFAEHAALYVFRGKPSARAIERKLDALRS
ncbi:MAG: DUF790 family protein [Pseudomonadota bacterium]